MNNSDQITQMLISLLIVAIVILVILIAIFVYFWLKGKKKKEEIETNRESTSSDAKKIPNNLFLNSWNLRQLKII